MLLVEAESKRSVTDRLSILRRAFPKQAQRADKAQSVKGDQVKAIEQTIKREESKGERHRHLATQTQRRDQGLSSVQSSLCYLYFSGLSSHELRLAITFSTFVTSSRNLINASVRPIFSIVYFTRDQTHLKQSWSSKFQSCNFTWTPRQNNKVADILARSMGNQRCGFTYHFYAPIFSIKREVPFLSTIKKSY